MNITSQVLNAEQFFLVNGQRLSGVSNVSLSYSNPLENSPLLGAANFGFLLNGPTESSVEFSRTLIYSDPILNFTGDSSFSGEFIYGGKSYSFQSGYLTSYSVSCGVGDIPQVNARVSVWCGMNSGISTAPEQVNDGLFIPSPKSIVASGLDFSSNRVKNFTYSLEISRQPIYSIEGGKNAESVEFIAPISVSASVSLDASNSNVRNSYAFSENYSNDSVNITVKNRQLTETISNFSIPNCQVLSESISSTADGQPEKTINFGGFFS